MAFTKEEYAVVFLNAYCCRFVWPRDLCYVRYWRRNDDGSYGKWFACPVVYFPWFLSFSFSFGNIQVIFVIVQLCYFVLGSTRTVVRNQDVCVPILKVKAKSFLFYTENSRD